MDNVTRTPRSSKLPPLIVAGGELHDSSSGQLTLSQLASYGEGASDDENQLRNVADGETCAQTSNEYFSDLLDSLKERFESRGPAGLSPQDTEVICSQLLRVSLYYRQQAKEATTASSALAVAHAQRDATESTVGRLRSSLSLLSERRVLPASNTPIETLREEVTELADQLATEARRAGLPEQVIQLRDADFGSDKDRRLYLTEQKMALLQQLVIMLRRRVTLTEAEDSLGRLVQRFGTVESAIQHIDKLEYEVQQLRLRENRFDVDALLSRTPGLPPKSVPSDGRIDDVSLRVLLAALQNELGRLRDIVRAESEPDSPDQDTRDITYDALKELCMRVFPRPPDPQELIRRDVRELSADPATVNQEATALQENEFQESSEQWAATPDLLHDILESEKQEGQNECSGSVIPLVSHVEAVQTALSEEITQLRTSLDAYGSLAASTHELRTMVLSLSTNTKNPSFNSKTRLIAQLSGQLVSALAQVRHLNRVIAGRDLTLSRQQLIIIGLTKQVSCLNNRSILSAKEISSLRNSLRVSEGKLYVADKAIRSLTDLSGAFIGLLSGGAIADTIGDELGLQLRSSGIQSVDGENVLQLVQQALACSLGISVADIKRDSSSGELTDQQQTAIIGLAKLAAIVEKLSQNSDTVRTISKPAITQLLYDPITARMRAILDKGRDDIAQICDSISNEMDRFVETHYGTRENRGCGSRDEAGEYDGHTSAAVQTEEPADPKKGQKHQHHHKQRIRMLKGGPSTRCGAESAGLIRGNTPHHRVIMRIYHETNGVGL